ncbi:CPTP-like protein [Mya arenaria]|uniref:CPTP-like protein n=1 Tax=Mya arenaria TaxID=6604 RepID=A0ABY7EYW8_MYAAR|nr:ceramide-1-phosphate transfer protein-like [Mya arenaria]WAR13851.1 CPTP-like protein [Mya arenaria]
MAAESDHFCLQRLYDLFYACHAEDGTICLENYVTAYYEISKLLKLMGTVFGFVKSDVDEKIEILQEFRKSDIGDKYKTIQGMIEYEVETKTTNNKKKASGARTLLRLHRALEFIVDLFKALKESGEHDKMSAITSKSYYRTLSKHHPWLIRKGVDVAVYTLPSRKHFIEKLKISDMSQAEKLLESTAALGHKIFDVVEQAYTDNKLHDLP